MILKEILNVIDDGFWINWMDDCGYMYKKSDIPKELMKAEILYITVDANNELTIEVE